MYRKQGLSILIDIPEFDRELTNVLIKYAAMWVFIHSELLCNENCHSVLGRKRARGKVETVTLEEFLLSADVYLTVCQLVCRYLFGC